MDAAPTPARADYAPRSDAATGRGALTVLGFETSCDETAAAVVRLSPGGAATVLSSVVHSQSDDHAPFGGVVPEIAARSHVETIAGVARRAMAEASLSHVDLDGVAATAGPGLVGGVMVGLTFAKGVAMAAGRPLVAVNHLEGHAVSARLAAPVDYPFLLLLVSGGHCQLLEVRGIGDMTRLGSTIDDAAGEAFDKIAKALGLGYPGGPALERLAAESRAAGRDGARFNLPRALLGRRDCDFSFSGLKTAAARIAQTLETHDDRADLAQAVEDAIARQLAERTARAMHEWREPAALEQSPSGTAAVAPERRAALKPSRSASGAVAQNPLLVAAGGVAANATVRRVLEATAAAHGFGFLAPPLAYCTDNAAMIALAGAERLALGLTSGMETVARPRWPLDEARALADPVHVAGRKGPKA